jgi:hypothetical protein
MTCVGNAPMVRFEAGFLCAIANRPNLSRKRRLQWA